MSRKGKAEIRDIIPDPIYNDVVVSSVINRLMIGGKKTIAERIMYTAMENSTKTLKSSDPIDCLYKALSNIQPKVEVRSRRVGGATYQVPMEVSPRRSHSLSIRWLIEAARSRAGKSMEEKLGSELVDAFNSRGAAVKKKENMHRSAEANKAFSHYRW